MKRLAILLLILPTLVFADIGKVSYSFPLDIDQPFGMTRDGDLLIIADRATGKLLGFNTREKKIVDTLMLPCPHPYGIAKDKKGLWVSDWQNNRIFHFDLEAKKADYILHDVETDALGLAWDGECLWATSRNKFLKLDPSDGTELQTFDGPGRETTAIYFDGAYLWLSERYDDKIVCATHKGEIFGVLPSPGPYPTGICRIGTMLYVLDFEDRMLYALDIAKNSQPYYTGKAYRRGLRFTCALDNQGPSSDVNGRLYACVAKEGPHQKILEPLKFFPQNIKFVKDKWGQKFAHLGGGIAAHKSLEMGYETKIETRDLNYFILPGWVEPLEKIPAKIRKKYLVDGHKLKMNDPYIKELVKKIVGDEKNPFWIAFKIHKYLHLNIKYKMTGGWNAAPTILKRGNGSCSEFTFCFIALARAAGLPARYEAGLVVRGDDGSIDEVYHRWPQAYLPPFGWIPIDPSRGIPATTMDVAKSFGSLSHRFFVTTHSGGDSPYLGWTYNYNAFYEFCDYTVVNKRAEGKWYPVKK